MVLVMLPLQVAVVRPSGAPVTTAMGRVGEKSVGRNQEPGNRHHDENLKESGLFHSEKKLAD